MLCSILDDVMVRTRAALVDQIPSVLTIESFFIVSDEHLFRAKIFSLKPMLARMAVVAGSSLGVWRGHPRVISRLSGCELDYLIVLNVSQQLPQNTCLVESLIHEICHIDSRQPGGLFLYEKQGIVSLHGGDGHDLRVAKIRNDLGLDNCTVHASSMPLSMIEKRLLSQKRYDEIATHSLFLTEENISETIHERYRRKRIEIL